MWVWRPIIAVLLRLRKGCVVNEHISMIGLWMTLLFLDSQPFCTSIKMSLNDSLHLDIILTKSSLIALPFSTVVNHQHEFNIVNAVCPDLRPLSYKPEVFVCIGVPNGHFWVFYNSFLQNELLSFKNWFPIPTLIILCSYSAISFLWREQADYTSGFVHSCMNSDPIPLMLSILTSILL